MDYNLFSIGSLGVLGALGALGALGVQYRKHQKVFDNKPKNFDEQLSIILASMSFPLTPLAPLTPLTPLTLSGKSIATFEKLRDLKEDELTVCDELYNSSEVTEIICLILNVLKFDTSSSWYQFDNIIFTKTPFCDAIIKLESIDKVSTGKSIKISIDMYSKLINYIVSL